MRAVETSFGRAHESRSVIVPKHPNKKVAWTQVLGPEQGDRGDMRRKKAVAVVVKKQERTTQCA